jgi:hypothetical protein
MAVAAVLLRGIHLVAPARKGLAQAEDFEHGLELAAALGLDQVPAEYAIRLERLVAEVANDDGEVVAVHVELHAEQR